MLSARHNWLFGEVGVVFRMADMPRADIPGPGEPGHWTGAWRTPAATQPSLGAHGLPRYVTCQIWGGWLQAWTDWAWEPSLVSHQYHIRHKRRGRAWPARVSDKHVDLGSPGRVFPRNATGNVTSRYISPWCSLLRLKHSLVRNAARPCAKPATSNSFDGSSLASPATTP